MTANPALKKLMAAWESKQAKNARKAGGLGLVAVSLAACGSSSSSDPDPDGQTFTLTTGADTFTGEEGDDTFNAPLADASGSLQGLLGIQTLGGQDVIVGGDGEDVLNAELNATGTTQNPTITDVEVLNFTVMPLPIGFGDLLGSYAVIDLSRSEGYEEIWNIDSRYSLEVVNVRTDVEGDAPIIGMSGVRGDTTFYVEYDADEAVAEQDVVAINVGSAGTGSAGLEIDAPGGIGTLNLQVSSGVRLDLESDAAGIENLNISGTGLLLLEGEDEFENLVTLDSTGYGEGLDIDVSGSSVLTSVAMGIGGDRVVVDHSVVRDTLSADMGAGQDTFAIVDADWGVLDSDEITALSFDVTGAQTLEFANDVDLGGWPSGPATLNLEGFSDLETITFQDFDADGNSFTIEEAPETLLMTASDEFDMDGGLFTVEGVVDLTVEATGRDVMIDGGLNSETLETLVINAADDAELSADGGLDALTSIEVNALGTAVPLVASNAEVTLENLDGDEFGALESVVVTAADEARLELDGRAPVLQTQTFTASVAGIGVAVIEFDFPDVGIVGASDAGFIGSLSDIVSDLNANLIAADSEYRADYSGGEIQFTRLVAGPAPEIALESFTVGGAAVGGISNDGVQVEGLLGSGFEALDGVVVDGDTDAEVFLTDVYGEFTLEVTAGEAATVELENTNVTEVSVTAGDHADIDVEGALYGNPNLVSITVESTTADVNLSDDLSSLTTLNLTGVSTQFTVDASNADFEPVPGDYVSYLIGATASTEEDEDSSIEMADARETVTFTEEGFGTVVLNGFTAGPDPMTGDRIDLSELGFTNNGQLTFEVGNYDDVSGVWTQDGTGDDVRITDLAGGPNFDGEIIVTGDLAGGGSDLSDDLSQYNMTYA